MKWPRFSEKVTFMSFAIVIIAISLPDLIVTSSTEALTFETTQEIPKKEVGLLLGTSKMARGGKINLFYKYRIEAAVRLFESNKIKYILISGDNSHTSYNEPKLMKEDLIKRGIPASRIFLDYAGFRTLDSVIRSKEIFGQRELIIISQKFHNERAIYIAKKNGIDAYGYNAKEVTGASGLKNEDQGETGSREAHVGPALQ